MTYQYDRGRDRFVGHSYPGGHAGGFVQYELDELELGARTALMIDNPEQWFWELFGEPLP